MLLQLHSHHIVNKVTYLLFISFNMAFVSQADRRIQELPNPPFLAAPGSYQIAQDNTKIGKNCAPFCTTAPRRLRQNTAQAPGPASYNNLHNSWYRSLTTYSNNNSVIIKLHPMGTPPFQSHVKRFNPTINQNPGPGQYLVEPEIAEKMAEKRAQKERGRSNKIVKQMKHRPSISKTMYLSQRHIKTQQQQFHPQPIPKKVKLVTDWSKNNVQRFQPNHYTQLGPGKYEVTPTKSKKGKIHHSNFFLSNTVRTFDNIVLKANNQQTLQLRSMKPFKAEGPAPGSYNLDKVERNQPVKYKNSSFGTSNKHRFTKSKTQQDDYMPFYQVKHSFEPRSFLKKNIPFNSDTKRLPMTQSSSLHPGPGYYSVQRKSRQVGRSIQLFGSSAARQLFDIKGNAQVGPGYYESEAKKKEEQSRQSTVFASKLQRGFQSKDTIDPRFASYDLSREDISRKAFQQKVHRQNLGKIDCGKPPFDKITPRFKHYQERQVSAPKYTSQQIESIMKQKKQAERIKLIEQANKQAIANREDPLARGGQRFKKPKNGPGVGDYAIRANWTKKSYNVKYMIKE